MSSYYGRTRDTLARAHEALARTASIHEEIADRRNREALGLIPEPYSPPPPAQDAPIEEEVTLTRDDFPHGLVAVAEGYPQPPINNAADLQAARLLSTGFAQEVLAQIIAAARAECLEDIDALRSELMASRRRRRRKNSTANEEAGNDPG